MMGPVQEKETNTKVKAIRKILSIPLVVLALLSMALDQEEGNVISNAPKKETANKTSNAKKKRLKKALVERLLSALAPNTNVIRMPSNR